jgi:hypothetical protein
MLVVERLTAPVSPLTLVTLEPEVSCVQLASVEAGVAVRINV